MSSSPKTYVETRFRYFRRFRSFNKSTPLAVERCIKKTIELDTTNKGDYYEFGIFKGYTFWYAQKVAKEQGIKTMCFFGFDSFSGLPEITEIDKTQDGGLYAGQFKYPIKEVEKHLNSKGVDWKKTFLIEGFFEKTLNSGTKKKYNMDKISVVLIDCDLYQSTMKVLDFIKDMIIDKTIILFDDWNCFGDKNKGERRAFREFLQKNKNISATEFFTYHREKYGKAFIINKKR